MPDKTLQDVLDLTTQGRTRTNSLITVAQTLKAKLDAAAAASGTISGLTPLQQGQVNQLFGAIKDGIDAVDAALVEITSSGPGGGGGPGGEGP